MAFHDRAEELTALESAFESPGHEFYVVYGRRRVGKTELLNEFGLADAAAAVDHVELVSG